MIFEAVGVQFLGYQEYSNIRSEKIRVLELGISVQTFTPNNNCENEVAQ